MEKSYSILKKSVYKTIYFLYRVARYTENKTVMLDFLIKTSVVPNLNCGMFKSLIAIKKLIKIYRRSTIIIEHSY